MTKKTTEMQDEEIALAFRDNDKITQALQEGIYIALRKHKQAGQPVCEWRDGQVHWVLPEDINV